MNPTNSILCTGCSEPFSASNLPRVAKCSHTYCQSCLKTLKCRLQYNADCLIDQQPNNSSTKVDTLPINTTIFKMIGIGGADSHKEICLLHDKQIDLVCVDDGVGICTNCALFGEHRNHNIKTASSVLEECAAMAEHTIAILSEIEVLLNFIQELEGTTSIKSVQNKIEQTFKDKKDTLTKQIKGRFYKLIDSIRNTQKSCLLQLQKIIQEEKKTLKDIVLKSVEEERKRSWIKQAQKLIQVVDAVKVDEATRYLNTSCSQNGLIKRGQYLIMQLNTFQNLVSEKLTESINEIAFEMDNSIFDRMLGNCYKLQKIKQERIVLKTQRHDDQFLLLEQQEVYPITPSTVQKQQIVDSASSSMFMDIPELAIQKLGVNVHSFIEKSERKIMDRSMIKEPLGVSNLDNKKKKKIKIPEKYQIVFDDLKNNRVDCLDFTNAELGDTIVIQLTEYIKNSGKLKTIKLIRNKLTDECLTPLLQACLDSRVSSLNLSQNSLTDKALDILQKTDLKDLKNLTLSQNKLNLRNSKIKIAEFKKKGLTISI